jgi:lycopene beta-cyclase
MTDLLLVGGGLANGLLAARLAATRPNVSFLVLEAGPALGGNHTWSFHGSDVTPDALAWLTALGAHRFEGHDVRLPGLQRTLSGTYHSLRSEDFAKSLRRILGPRVRTGARVVEAHATHVVLESGERIDAGTVIDARAVLPPWPCGWQKFLGQELELVHPHGLERPMLMDATVEQDDGFRFIYALPFSRTRVLVEDTIYSDTPELDLADSRTRIAEWATTRGWRVAAVTREEHAALPIPLSGQAPQHDRPVLGVSAGFFHATTGYSLPFAVRLAKLIASRPSFEAKDLTQFLNAEAKQHWRQQRFFRLLNRMLFVAAKPAERVRVFASFYRHEAPLIERFYASALRTTDVFSVLAKGSKTVPALKALGAAAGG